MKHLIGMLILLFVGEQLWAQCCAGGSGSPIAGGTSQGVLAKYQVELSTNLQLIGSSKFYTHDHLDSNKYFDEFSSSYQYFRLGYGVSEKLTFSIESGYYFNKKEIGLNNDANKTYDSKGIGDLIIFPRYNVLSLHTPKSTTELTLGLGIKIPLGSYNDSTGFVEPFSGKTLYITNPQAVQPTTGAHDVIFYGFFVRAYPSKNLKFFANTLYIKKGWNPLGEKAGDFASIGLFASKSILQHVGLAIQLRGEWVDAMQLNKNILLYAYPNYDPLATGYKKVFFTPQVSFSKGPVTAYGLVDIPVYQYVNQTQVVTQSQFTVGLSYRFYTKATRFLSTESTDYFCPMCPEVSSKEPGLCPKCGMDLEHR